MARLIDQLVGHRETLEPLFRAHANDKLAATLLFVGPSGIGKKKAALVLAQALVCETNKGAAPGCGECGGCLRIEKEQSESLMIVEPDGASIKIEQARDILQFIFLQKLGRARVVIIDQAHLLNPQSANALLKSLEEPPAGTHFLLISHMAASMLPTIRSRSQLVRFRPLSKPELAKVLGDEADPWILDMANGSVEAAHRFGESREDYQELESMTAEYLKESTIRFPGESITRLKELTKDRSAQTFFAGLVQGLLRDSLRLQSGLRPVHDKAPWAEISTSLSELAPRSLGCLAERTLGIESDMARNVDRGLILENFAVYLRKAGQWDGSTSTRT